MCIFNSYSYYANNRHALFGVFTITKNFYVNVTKHSNKINSDQYIIMSKFGIFLSR